MSEATLTTRERLSLPQVIEAVKVLPEVAPFARVVGQWVWVEFPNKPAQEIREELKRLGFHWNKTRNAWQNHCGFYSRHSSSDPRYKYMVVPVSEIQV